LREVMGVSKTSKQPKVARGLMRMLGFEQVVELGTRLSRQTRIEQCWVTRSPQRNLATKSALTVPLKYLREVSGVAAHVPTSTPPLNSRREFGQVSVINTVTCSASASSIEGASRRTYNKSRTSQAAAIAYQMPLVAPQLAKVDPRALIPHLMRFTSSSPRWTAGSVWQACNAVNHRLDRLLPETWIPANPVAFFASLAKKIDPVGDFPYTATSLQHQADCECDQGWVEAGDGRLRRCRASMLPNAAPPPQPPDRLEKFLDPRKAEG
jgi:hypothetical protein